MLDKYLSFIEWEFYGLQHGHPKKRCWSKLPNILKALKSRSNVDKYFSSSSATLLSPAMVSLELPSIFMVTLKLLSMALISLKYFI